MPALAHLYGPAAEVRQVLAAHFVKDCAHVIEIGSHRQPITGFLTHRPLSVLCVDPKIEPYEARELNGEPCQVRHLARKFQEIEYDFAARSYGLVMLGLSLRPFGGKDPVNRLLLSLIDNARAVVIDYPFALERSVSQIEMLLPRPGLKILCRVDLDLHDAQIDGSPYAKRRFLAMRPEG